MSELFTPFTLKSITLRNRVGVAPMCQYSAENGFVSDWHLPHYIDMARGGPGLVIVEATAVSSEGRITPGCLGLWNDEQAEGLARIASGIKSAGAVPGIQIGHAGPKASANLPWEGDDHIPEGDARGWQPIGPSANAFGGGLDRVPKAMTLEDIDRVKADFVAAAKRALAAGFEWLELHFAHGYLAQSFFSVHANQRTDDYGGDFAGRSRFIKETLDAVRKVWPEHLPLTARFGVIEYDGDEESRLAEGIEMAKIMRDSGLDLLNASLGFATVKAKVPWGPAFFVPVAGKVREATSMPVSAAWCIDAADDAERAIATGQQDLVLMARSFLSNPHYAYSLAQQLGVDKAEWTTLPAPYAYWLSRYRGPGKGAAQ